MLRADIKILPDLFWNLVNICLCIIYGRDRLISACLESEGRNAAKFAEARLAGTAGIDYKTMSDELILRMPK